MQEKEFLFNLLFDMYENFCETQDILQEEFDSMFFDEDGNEITELEYLEMKSDEVLCSEVIDAVYCQIKEDGLPSEVNQKVFRNLLFSKFYLYNYNPQSPIIRYFNDTDGEEIYRLFLENYDFGIDVIKSYYKTLINHEKCEQNRKAICDNQDEEHFLKFEEKLSTTNVVFLNDLLRDVICNLYNHFIYYGYDDISALNGVWAYFTRDFDPLGELDKMGFDVATKNIYKAYMIGLICADVYEDACNKSIIDSENKKDRLADSIAIENVRQGKIRIPMEEEVRNRLLKHFILLQDEKEKKKENREKTYVDGRIDILKKVNPAYKLDELTFTSKQVL